MKRSLLVILALGCAAAAVWWAYPTATPSPTTQASKAAASAADSPAAPASPTAADSPAANAPGPAMATWLAQDSPLRGSSVDGGWSVNAQGQLVPDIALRRRFDYFLQLLGQQPIERISALVQTQAEQALSPAAAREVMQLWQRYLELQQVKFTTQVNPQDPHSITAALAERQIARRSALGRVWADAFYAQEEAEILQMTQATGPRSAALIDRSKLGDDALARLAQEEAQQAQWQARLSEARAELERINNADELSAIQRQRAQHALLMRFNAREQVRAAALLGLPPP
ncbi:MAG: lipase chaperone [Ideonella sp.]|nr:lipase chaperone [Ideonella sp.]